MIISLYRGERYLDKFLRNIVEQTSFERTEYVIDHNAPSEREMELIGGFMRDHPGRLRHLVHDDVVTYGCSWNRCIDNASAEVLAIWNVDDLRTPDSLDVGARPILDDQTDLVFGNYTRVNRHGETIGDMVRISDTDQYYYSRRFVFGPFFMFRKSLCERAGMLDEQMRSSADLDFAIRLTLHARIMPMDVNMGYYLDEGKGLSTRASSRRKTEDTAIGLRYGNYDWLYYHKLPQALKYDVTHLVKDGGKRHVMEFVPDYQRFVEGRKSSILKGPMHFASLELGQFKKMVTNY